MKYRTIVADPPWDVKAGPLIGGPKYVGAYHGPTRELAYPSLSVTAIATLPVAELADDDAVMFLWTTNGYLPTAFDVLRAWGFAYSTTLVWAKAPMGSGLGGAFGISTEFVLYGRRGSLTPHQRMPRTWFDWKRPYELGRHSAKPPHLQDLLEVMFDGPRLELFARTQRLGWDTWGNESLNHIEMERA